MVCSTSGLSSPDDKCSDGYYCPLGSISNTEVICPAGYFCPAFSASRGAVGPVPCARGTYSSSTGATACTTCPAGTYCDASTDAALQSPTPCPAGFYCQLARLITFLIHAPLELSLLLRRNQRNLHAHHAHLACTVPRAVSALPLVIALQASIAQLALGFLHQLGIHLTQILQL